MKRFVCSTVFVAALIFGVSLNSFAGDVLDLKWKFPVGARYTYDLSQSTTSKMDIKNKDVDSNKVNDLGNMKMDSGGPITISCNGEGATVRLDLSVTDAVVSGQEISEDQRNMMKNSIEMPMDAEGKITQGRYSAGNNTQLLFDLLFPLPPKGLNVLEPVSQDIVMFSSGGMSNLKGKAVYTFNGIKNIDGLICADYHVSCKLKTVVDKKKANNIDASASLTGEYDCLFAINNGFFVSVDGTSTMKMNAAFNSIDNAAKMKMVMNQKASLKLKSAEYDQTPETQQEVPQVTQDDVQETAQESQQSEDAMQ